jgi:hypothetical protein
MLSSLISHLIQTYNLAECPLQTRTRTAFFLSELSLHYAFHRINSTTMPSSTFKTLLLTFSLY